MVFTCVGIQLCMDTANGLMLKPAKNTRSRERPMPDQDSILPKISSYLPTKATTAAPLYCLLSTCCPIAFLTQFCNEWEDSKISDKLSPCHNHLHIIIQKQKLVSVPCSAFRKHYRIHLPGSELLIFSAFPGWMCHQSLFLQLSMSCQCLNDSHSRHGKDYRSCSLPVHMWSDATVRAKTQGWNKSKEKGTHGMIFFPGSPVVSIWQWSGVKRISFILRILTGCNRIL